MDKNKNRFVDAKEIMELTGLSKSAAYKLIQQLNEELAQKGYMYVRGRVIYPYFYERFFGKDGDRDASIMEYYEFRNCTNTQNPFNKGFFDVLYNKNNLDSFLQYFFNNLCLNTKNIGISKMNIV